MAKKDERFVKVHFKQAAILNEKADQVLKLKALEAMQRFEKAKDPSERRVCGHFEGSQKDERFVKAAAILKQRQAQSSAPTARRRLSARCSRRWPIRLPC